MKTKFYSVLLVGLVGWSSYATALSDLNFSGEFNLLAALKQLPSRDQGVTAFSLPSIRLDFGITLQESNEIFVELETSEFRDAASKRYDTQAKEAYLSLVSVLPGYEMRYGLVPNPWVEMQRQSWDYDFWGLSSEVFLIRYGYSSWADLGAVIHGDLPSEWGEFSFSVVNGEGASSEEIGKHKELQLVVSLQRWEPFYLTLGYLHGAYDVIDVSINEKKRSMIELSYMNELNFIGLSYYDTSDPADVMTNERLGGGVDVLALHGSSVAGQGVSLLTRRKITARTDLFLRADWLNPVKSQSEKTLQAYAAGIGFQSNEDLLWVFGAEQTSYGAQFAGAARDQLQFLAATQVRF